MNKLITFIALVGFSAKLAIASQQTLIKQALNFCGLDSRYELKELPDEEKNACHQINCYRGDELIFFKNDKFCFEKSVPDTSTKRDGEFVGPPEPAPEKVEDVKTPDEPVQSFFIIEEAVKKVGHSDNCDPNPEEATEFEREEPRPFVLSFSTTQGGNHPNWGEIIETSKDKESRINGFSFRNLGENAVAGKPVDPELQVERRWRFYFRDNSRRETFIWVTDDAGSGYTSHYMDSILLFFPRKVRPTIKEVGEEVHVTLTTGEKMIFDAKTKMIKDGVIKEGKVDLNKNHRKRSFAPLDYTGTGISIRTDQRGAEPRMIPKGKTVAVAIVTQNGKKCEVPRADLWDQKNVTFKFPSDEKLLEFLNQKCKEKFSL